MFVCDMFDMVDLGEMCFGGGFGISFYSFYGCGILNGVLLYLVFVIFFENVVIGL